MAGLGEKLGVPILLPDNLLAAIGALTNVYSLAELFAAMAAWHSLNLPAYEGVILTATLSLKQRLGIVASLGPRGKITAEDVAVIKEIEIEFTRDGGLSSRRNSMIHAVWTTDNPAGYGGTVKPLIFARSGKASVGDPATEDTINTVTSAIAVQSKRLQTILERWGALDGLTFDKPLTLP